MMVLDKTLRGLLGDIKLHLDRMMIQIEIRDEEIEALKSELAEIKSRRCEDCEHFIMDS